MTGLVCKICGFSQLLKQRNFEVCQSQGNRKLKTIKKEKPDCKQIESIIAKIMWLHFDFKCQQGKKMFVSDALYRFEHWSRCRCTWSHYFKCLSQFQYITYLSQLQTPSKIFELTLDRYLIVISYNLQKKSSKLPTNFSTCV